MCDMNFFPVKFKLNLKEEMLGNCIHKWLQQFIIFSNLMIFKKFQFIHIFTY